jgi:methylenetetrahydrofolate dehydrogenase (NADP+)/methenyltetrahydrofolate cyclohydrolase
MVSDREKNMAELLKGIDVANAMKQGLIDRSEDLKGRGVEPCLAIVRVGERPDDLAYENGVIKRFGGLGVKVRVNVFPDDIGQPEFEREFSKINNDESVHGILLFRPLPKTLDEEPIKRIINPDKDVDCMCAENFARVFIGDDSGYPPCTPAGVVEMLKHFEIPLKGAEVALVGRSMVVGKPLAMLLLGENATVTICHSRTADLPAVCRRADVVIAAVGVAKMVKKEYIKPGAVVIDVGINIDDEGNMCGDVDFDEVSQVASKITPVPGGVGTVTTSVLAKHTLKAAERSLRSSL